MMFAGVAVMLLAACGSSGDGNGTLAEANSSGNEAAAAVENKIRQSDAPPLQKEQALALMKQRHENYEKIGDAMKAISRELKGENPNLGNLRAGAATIAQLAPQVPTWFPAGTGPGVGKTDARAEIWSKPEDFAAKSQDFREAAAAFETAARGSDLAAIRSAHAKLGKSCKGCHDLYREKE
ncbi:MAG TPA: cytochrome c [Allosphingosinicella sp.]